MENEIREMGNGKYCICNVDNVIGMFKNVGWFFFLNIIDNIYIYIKLRKM